MQLSGSVLLARWSVVFVLCLCASSLPAQTQSPEVEATSPSKSVLPTTLVEAIVTDKKGNYISDLASQDFRVWEDDKEQQVKSVSFANLVPDSTDKARYSVLLFDNFNVTNVDQKQVRQVVARFVETIAGPNQYAAILDYGKGLEVNQNFTTDAALLKDEVLHNKSVTPSSSSDRMRAANIKGRPLFDNADTDFGVHSLLLAIRSVANNLALVPGRKSLILLSSGFPMSSREQSDLLAATNACNKANVAIYTVAQRNPELASGPGLPSRHDTNGPGQISSFGFSSSHQVLESLSASTGGLVIEASGDLLAKMEKIAQEQSHYYVVGFTPPASPDGTCHNLKFRVQRSNAVVRARSSYCTGKMADPLVTGGNKVPSGHN